MMISYSTVIDKLMIEMIFNVGLEEVDDKA